MKKFAMAAVAAAAMMAGGAQAYTVGTFSSGFVVPNVVFDASGTTAVGIISKGTGCAFWTFFDQDSKHVTDGFIPMTDNDYHSFVWSANAGENVSGKRGYLVFTAGNGNGTSTCTPTPNAGMKLAGNAFQVLPASSDVAFVPVIDGVDTTAIANLSLMGEDSITTVTGAVVLTNPPVAGVSTTSAEFSMRYYIDGKAGGNDTNIVVWSTGDQRGSHTVFMYDDAQHPKSVNFNLTHTELDWFDVESIVGRPTSYVDGFITWNVTNATFAPVSGGVKGTTAPATVSVMTYSVISAPAFGAVQTMLGAHR